MDIHSLVEQEITLSLETFSQTLQNTALKHNLNKAILLCLKSLKKGGKIMLIGNGGSAADAQHLAAELICRFKANRASIPAIALTTDTSALTAIGNDFSFKDIFQRQIEGLGKPEDTLIAISTSGNSGNIIDGILRAKAMGIQVIGMTGQSESKLTSISDVCLSVPSTITAKIQEVHICLGHILCQAIEQGLMQSQAHQNTEQLFQAE